jgi:hypothetical protein
MVLGGLVRAFGHAVVELLGSPRLVHDRNRDAAVA